MAKLGLVQDGIDFAMKQITAGIVSFAPVLTDELDEFRQVLLTHQMEYQESYDEKSVIDDGDGDEDAEMPSEESCERDSHFGDIVLDALANIGAAQVFVGPLEEIRAGVTCWKLPLDASQGRYNGRNGSNAGSFISILIGYNLI